MRTSKICALLQKSVATEAINFQYDSFGKDLEELFGKLREEKVKSDTTDQDYPVAKEISSLILKRLGLNVKIFFNTDLGPGMFSPKFDKNHVFKNTYGDSDWEFLISNTSGMNKLVNDVISFKNKNEVNLITAKVSGVFSELLNTLYLPLWFINNNTLSIRQVVSVVLHELGHSFTFLEYLGRQTSMNEVLQIVASDVFDITNNKIREFVISNLTENEDRHPDLEKELSNKNPSVRISVVLKNQFKPSMSGITKGHYDASSCEAMADNFAARFGYSQDLVIANDQMFTLYPEKNQLVRASILSLEIATYGIIPFLTLSHPFIVFAILLIAINRVCTGGEINTDYTYDKLKIRYKRLREQVITGLKDKTLPKPMVEKALQDIEVIDAAISKIKPFTTFTDDILNFLLTKNRNAIKEAEQQRILEEIASNDLFIKAAQLKIES